MEFALIKMLCRDYNLHLCIIFAVSAVSNAKLIIDARNDRNSNRREFGHVYERFKLQEKKFDSVESGLTEVAKGQIETDKKVVEVLHEVREAKIKLEEKFKRYHAERHETA